MALAETAAWAGDMIGSPPGHSSWTMPPADIALQQVLQQLDGALHGPMLMDLCCSARQWEGKTHVCGHLRTTPWFHVVWL